LNIFKFELSQGP